MTLISTQIGRLLALLDEGLEERRQVIGLALLALFSGESLFLLGPPGVAKSLVARRFKYVFENGVFFEYLMSRFSTPDELFGPVSISTLKNEDKYEHIIQDYLPTAHVAFLDEIWKAGPGIQNTLLRIINAKIFRNGTQIVHVPLRLLV
ncbi:AAA family ATPase, partial [Parabacteroides sp.]